MENEYIVVLSNDHSEDFSRSSREVLIYPPVGGWNDFGHKTNTTFVGKDINGNRFSGNIFIAIFEEPIVENNQKYTFFTMLPNMEDYRALLKNLGKEESNIFLEAIYDLVKLQQSNSRSKLFLSAKETKIFKLSFMRNSENFFTFHNAQSILDGLEHESIKSISTTLNLNFKLDCFTNEHQFLFKFDLDSVLPKRICIMIGKNGIGKSQALNNIVSKSLNNDTSFSDPNNDRPMINRLLAIATPGETKNTFPAERTDSRIHYSRLLLTRDSNSKSSRGTGNLLVQLIRSEESIKDMSRWNLFYNAIGDIFNVDELIIPLDSSSISKKRYLIKINSEIYISLKNLNNLGEQESLEIWGAISDNAKPFYMKNEKAYPLSSGQISFYLFSLQACLMIENATLVLLDEPETHLHPNFISDFIVLLDKLLELTGSISIIATHSAYFVREMPRSQVHSMKENHTNIEIKQPRLKTFGADIGSISYFVFEDDITNRLIDKVKKIMTNKNIQYEELQSELSSEAIMDLKEHFYQGNSI